MYWAEIRPEEAVRRRGQLLHVLLNLPLLIPPGEVGVGLLESRLAEDVHHRRLRECLRQEEHIRIGLANLSQ